jgi:glycosyltransferase involved in cell wall biosynthesis
MISIVVISKDEPALNETLTEVRHQISDIAEPCEIVVVDASDGRLDNIRRRHGLAVRWVQFERPSGVTVTIPHQRNVGVHAADGDVIVFTDSGCYPENGWLANLTAPLLKEGEWVVAGQTFAAAEGIDPYGDSGIKFFRTDGYLRECPTINMAFRREAFNVVGGFDESFAYGSDIDFSWRLTDAGYLIRAVPDAIVRHDWGNWRRQVKRAYAYGKARARLYVKHKSRRRDVLRNDPVVVLYPLFLLGLPLTAIFPLYPVLLLIPAWRNRSQGAVKVVVDHLAYGLGVLAEIISQ